MIQQISLRLVILRQSVMSTERNVVITLRVMSFFCMLHGILSEANAHHAESDDYREECSPHAPREGILLTRSVRSTLRKHDSHYPTAQVSNLCAE